MLQPPFSPSKLVSSSCYPSSEDFKICTHTHTFSIRFLNREVEVNGGVDIKLETEKGQYRLRFPGLTPHQRLHRGTLWSNVLE